MAVSFGSELRNKEFMLDDQSVFLNNGSYGTLPRSIFNYQSKLKTEVERHPDDWYRQYHPEGYARNLHLLCQYLSADYDCTVLVENVTTGLSSIMNSLASPDSGLLKAGDVVVTYKWTYHAVWCLCESLSQWGIHHRQITQDFPLESADVLLDNLRLYLKNNPDVKVLFVDHIVSQFAIVLPVKEICVICKEYDVISVIDGAHGPGQLPLNIADIGADFYTGNLHKWMFVPRGCAVVSAKRAFLPLLGHTVVSHFRGSKIQHDFCVRGTMDNTNYHCIEPALEFIKKLGGLEAIVGYCSSLLTRSTKRLSKAWNTDSLHVNEEMQAPLMRVVRAPPIPNMKSTVVGAGKLEKVLRERFNIQSMISAINGALYIRLSIHVYNTEEDIEKLELALLELASETVESNTSTNNNYSLPLVYWNLNSL